MKRLAKRRPRAVSWVAEQKAKAYACDGQRATGSAGLSAALAPTGGRRVSSVKARKRAGARQLASPLLAPTSTPHHLPFSLSLPSSFPKMMRSSLLKAAQTPGASNLSRSLSNETLCRPDRRAWTEADFARPTFLLCLDSRPPVALDLGPALGLRGHAQEPPHQRRHQGPRPGFHRQDGASITASARATADNARGCSFTASSSACQNPASQAAALRPRG